MLVCVLGCATQKGNYMNRIKEIRLKRGFTQTQVGDAIGVRPNVLSQYETGVRTPSRLAWYALSMFYRVDQAWLEGLEDEKTLNGCDR